MANGFEWVAVTETGRPFGEQHQRADFTDHEIELMRDAYESGQMTMAQLAKFYECHRKTIWRIVTYRSRNRHAARWVKRLVA